MSLTTLPAIALTSIMALSSFGSFGSSSVAPPVGNDTTTVEKTNGSSGGGNSNTGNNDTTDKETTITINQGDRYLSDFMPNIYGNQMLCTLAYIGEDYALSAGHCGVEGAEIFTYPENEYVGKVIISDLEGNKDNMVIELADNVVGENSYSGDRITSMEEMSKDDVLCQIGSTTNKVTCSEQFGLARYNFMWSNSFAAHGDSGGPVWIEGKGLIGTISSLPQNGVTGISELWPTANMVDMNAPMAPTTSNWPGGK